VFIFDFENNYVSTFEIKRELDGTNLGEYFGAALASGDTNNDGLDELIVGAPSFSSQDGWDQGRFFVFSFSGNQTSRKAVQQEQVFAGKVTGGRFGTAVAYLGDLNADKFGGL
jgi:FG-GAP repeat